MPVVIEMVSDLVCPWCWLGKRRIETAIAMVPDVEVELLFRPYELDPSIPAGGVDYKEYMRKAFSSPEAKERSGAMRQALIDYGEAEDIPYRFDEITWRPNSLDAHRLVHWAQGQKKGAAAKEALFRAFFHDGRDIGDQGVLVDIARQIDLDPTIGRSGDALSQTVSGDTRPGAALGPGCHHTPPRSTLCHGRGHERVRR